MTIIIIGVFFCVLVGARCTTLLAGMRTSDFVGTAPRAKVGKYIVQNVSFESPSSGPSEPRPMDKFRQSAGVVWAEVRSTTTLIMSSVHKLEMCARVCLSY